MATTEVLDFIKPSQMVPIHGDPGTTNLVRVGDGLVAGFPLPKLDGVGFTFVSRIPALGTPVGTGLTFGLLLVDDPGNTGAGLVVRVGITVKKIVSGTDTLTFTGADTETEASVTMDATTGEVVAAAVACTAIDSLAASSWYLVRVRRLGIASTDTHLGRVICIGAEVRDT